MRQFFERALLAAVGAAAFWTAGITQGQRATVPFSFDVVSIKPDLPAAGVQARFSCRGIDPTSLTIPLGTCVGRLATLKRLIQYSYQNSNVELPEKWMDTEVFAIQAKAADSSATTWAQLQQMVQTMLADRFNLKLHPEHRDAQGYALLVGKDGPKFRESTANEGAVGSVRNGVFTGSQVNMGKFATTLSGLVHAPVVNETGLIGSYSFTMVWLDTTPDPNPESSGPSLFTVLRDELGLRLAPRTISSEALVVDHADKPAQN